MEELYGYVLAYDLPSEGFKFLYDSSKDEDSIKLIKSTAINKIASCRLVSTRQLQKLGLPYSQSVLLVPVGTTDKTIDDVTTLIETNYSVINSLLVGFNLPTIGTPFIRKIPIVKFQFTLFREVAHKKLMERLDEQLNNLADKIKELTTLEEKKQRQYKSRYQNEIKEVENLKDLAKKLDIEADEKFNLLQSMLRKCVSIVS